MKFMLKSPVKEEERFRDFLIKNNLNCITKNDCRKIIGKLLDYLMKSTRYNDISDFLRGFNQKKNYLKNISEVFDKLSPNKNIVLHYPIIITFNYFLENYLNTFGCVENSHLFQKSLHSFLLNKGKSKSANFLIKKLTKKLVQVKKTSFFLTIMNHENLFIQNYFNGIQNYLNWFYLSLEKAFESNYYKDKFNFSLGKVALSQNKKIKAFSLFIQAIEDSKKGNFRTKLIIIEWFILSSLLLKKINQTNNFINRLNLLNSKNLFQIKTIYNCINKNNMVLIEKLIFNTNRTTFILSSSNLLVKKFFKKIKKKLVKILSIFIRSSINKLAMLLGVSRKRTEMILSYIILKGEQKGYFVCTTDTYSRSLKTKKVSNIFINASLNLGSLVDVCSKLKI